MSLACWDDLGITWWIMVSVIWILLIQVPLISNQMLTKSLLGQPLLAAYILFLYSHFHCLVKVWPRLFLCSSIYPFSCAFFPPDWH